MKPKIMNFPNGLTVRELKELIKEWPETDDVNGDCEVWIDNKDGTSSPVHSIWPLNLREQDNGEYSSDIIFINNRG